MSAEPPDLGCQHLPGADVERTAEYLAESQEYVLAQHVTASVEPSTRF